MMSLEVDGVASNTDAAESLAPIAAPAQAELG